MVILAVALCSGSIARAQNEPPREVPLIQKEWDQLSNHDISQFGQIALDIDPKHWKHAETENFIIHYRRDTEAHKVVREIEYDLWYVTKTLGAAGKGPVSHKSHVYVFQDDPQWARFLAQTPLPSWAVSYAIGQDLFLNVRQETGLFDSETLAHETTHAVVARLFPGERWPLWLSEGFAQYMATASVTARKGGFLRMQERTLAKADMPLDTLLAMKQYPEDVTQVWALYQTAEKLVRFLMTQAPPERFLRFVHEILLGEPLNQAIAAVYPDTFPNYDTFLKKYQHFQK